MNGPPVPPPHKGKDGNNGRNDKKKKQEPNQQKPRDESNRDQPVKNKKGKNNAHAPRDTNPPRQTNNNRNNASVPNRNNQRSSGENNREHQFHQHSEDRVSQDVLQFCESLKKKQSNRRGAPLTTDQDVDMWKRSIEVAATPTKAMNPFRACLLKAYQELPDLDTHTPSAMHVANLVGNLHLSKEIAQLLFDIISTRLKRTSSLSTIRSPLDKIAIQRKWSETLSRVYDKLPDEYNLQQEIHTYVASLMDLRPTVAEAESESAESVIEGWFTSPTVGWLADGKWLSSRGLKNRYDNVDDYIATMRELWTTLTFCLGAAALWPKCRCPGSDEKLCNAPLMTRVTSTGQTCSMRVRRQSANESLCGKPAAWRCSRNRHDLICEECLAVKKKLLRGPRGIDVANASTDIYDGEVQSRTVSGESDIVSLCKVLSRKPPREGTNWRTSYRLQSPNLVGLVVLNSSNETLSEGSRLYFGEIVPHDRLRPENESIRRTNGYLDIRILSQPDASVMKPEMSLPPTVDKGCCVAVIDMQVFVPEVFSVLSTLTDKSFKVGLQKVPFNTFLLNAVPPEPLRFPQPISHQNVIWHAIDKSSLRSIRQLNDQQRLEFFETLLAMPTVRSLDQTQLQAFAYGLNCDLHCTQGPPGTGKSYVGVCLVLAFIALRDVLKRNGRSVGPILTLSYKNHALDEFLLDVLKQRDDLKRGGALVRLGKKSEHVELGNFTEKSCAAESKAHKDLMACVQVMKESKQRQQHWVRSRGIQGEITGDLLCDALRFASIAEQESFEFEDPETCYGLLKVFGENAGAGEGLIDSALCVRLLGEAEHWRDAKGVRMLLSRWIQGHNPPHRCQATVETNRGPGAQCFRYAKKGSMFCQEVHACSVDGCKCLREKNRSQCAQHGCRGDGGACKESVLANSPFCQGHSCAVCLTSECLKGLSVCRAHVCVIRGCDQPMLHPTNGPFCFDHCCEACYKQNCITVLSMVSEAGSGGVLCTAHKCSFRGCLVRRMDGGKICAEHRCQFCPASVDENYPNSKLCANHRCMHEEDGEQSCLQPKITLRDGRRSIYCRTHVCRGCIQLQSPSLNAPTIAPRYQCQDHGLCIDIDANGVQCPCLVAVDAEYCTVHDPSNVHVRDFCAGITTKGGKPCKSRRPDKEMNRAGRWYCNGHKDQQESHEMEKADVVRIVELSDEDVQVMAVYKEIATQSPPRPMGDSRSFKRLAECTNQNCSRKGLVSLDDNGWTCAHHSQRNQVRIPVLVDHDPGSESAAARDEGDLQRLVLGPVSHHVGEMGLKDPAVPPGPVESPSPMDHFEFVDDGCDADDDAGYLNHGLDPDEVVLPMDDEDEVNDQVRHNREIYESDSEDGDDGIPIDDDDEGESGYVRAGATSLDESDDPLEALKATDTWTWWDMSLDARREAAHRFIDAMTQQLRRCILMAEGYVAVARQKKAEAAAHALKNAVVIGGTIVGAARRLPALRAANPFAIIVEEACEVMEPTLAAVLAVESVEKLELIGDHRQLPAFVSNCWFNMATSMPSIKTSLFERLVTRSSQGRAASESVCTVLDVQRRMRRCIADLTRHEYEDVTAIQDHQTTATQRIGDRLPQKALQAFIASTRKRWHFEGRQIPGILPAIFFWNQKNNTQSRPKVGLSACNENEAKAVGSLIKHLLLCGVPKTSITVITPYQGQQREIIQQLRNLDILPRRRDALNDDVVHVSTVDRYQGDENDIIILSLVRTKPGNAFVTLLNRFIVATSRARLGFYIVGSTSAVVEDPVEGRSSRQGPQHWQTFLERLQRPDETRCDVFEGSRLGDELPICCPCHPEQSRKLISSDASQRDKAFPQVSNWSAFCQVPCTTPLKCGHDCALPCHCAEPSRHRQECEVVLPRPCRHHPHIPLVCNSVSLANVQPIGGEALLTAALRVWKCDIVSSYPRPACEHKEELPCYRHEQIQRGEEAWPPCKVPVDPYIHPVCGHKFSNLTCDTLSKYVADPPKCRTKVNRTLACGHDVEVECWNQDSCDQMDCQKDVQCPRPRCGHLLSTRCVTAQNLSRLWSLSQFVGVDEVIGRSPVVFHGGAYGLDEHTFLPEANFHHCKQEAYFQRACGHKARMKCHDAFVEAAKPAHELKACTEKVRIDCVFCQQSYEVPCSVQNQLSRGCPTLRFHFDIDDTRPHTRLIHEQLVTTAAAALTAAERSHWELQAKHLCPAVGGIGIRRNCDPAHIEVISCKRFVDLILRRGGPLKACQEMIQRELDCRRHSIRQHCFERDRVAPVCSAIVNEWFEFPQCGHRQCIPKCGDVLARRNTPIDQLRCYQLQQTTHVRCGHRVEVSCHQRKVVETWSEPGDALPPADASGDAAASVLAEVKEDALYCEPCADAPPCRVDVAFRRKCGHVTTFPCADAFKYTRRGGPGATPISPCKEETGGRHMLCGHEALWPCSLRAELESTWQPWGVDPDSVAIRPLPIPGLGENVLVYPPEQDYAPLLPPAHLAAKGNIACTHPVTVYFHECEHRRDVKCHEFYDAFRNTPLRCTERMTVQCHRCQGTHVYGCHELRAVNDGVREDWIAARCAYQVPTECRFCQVNDVLAPCNASVVQCRKQVTMRLPCQHEYRWMCGSTDLSGSDLMRLHNYETGKNPACRGCVVEKWESEMDWDVEHDALIAFGDQLVARLCDNDEQLEVKKVPLAEPITMSAHRAQRDFTIKFISDGIRDGRIPLVCPPAVAADQLPDYIAKNYELVFIANAAGKHADVANVKGRFSLRDTVYGQGLTMKQLNKTNLIPLLKEGGFVDVWVAAAFRGRRYEGNEPFGRLPVNAGEQASINRKVKEKVDLGYTSVRIVGNAPNAGRVGAAAAGEEDVDHGFVGDRLVNDTADHVFWKGGLVVPLFVLTVRVQSQCVICGDFLPSDHVSGALCADRHLICWGCLDNYIESASSIDGMAQYCDRDTGRLKCAACPLHYDGFRNAVHAPEDIGKRLLDFEAKKQLEKVLGEELRQQEKRLREEFKRFRQMDEENRLVFLLVKQIREEIMNPQCPRCRTVFVDFDGCFALTCSNQQCGAGFCAWCLQDCGRDAHGHVANCPRGNRDVYGNIRALQHVWNDMRREKINALLIRHPAKIRQKVVAEMQRDFDDLQLRL